MQMCEDSSMMMLRGQHHSGILTKEEKDESDLASYTTSSISTHDLMGNSAIGLSLHGGECEEDDDMDQHPYCNGESFHDMMKSYDGTKGLHTASPEPTIPRLMQMQMEKYGTSYFQRNESGYYSCFFVGCGKKLQANFSRHVAKHETDGDAVDPNLAQHMKSISPAGPPMQTCSHPYHMAWWHTPPEQPIGEFYNRSYKCKRCYIKQQMDRKKLRVASMENKEGLKTSSDNITSPGTPTHSQEIQFPPIEEEHFPDDPSTLSRSSSIPSLLASSSFPVSSVPPPLPRSSSPPPKRKKVSHHNPKDDLVLPEGWEMRTTTRKNGKSAGRVVPHWISPEGKKFRSKAAIKEFLAKLAPPAPPSASSSPSSSSSFHQDHLSSNHTHMHSHTHLHNNHPFSTLPPSLANGELPSSVLSTPLGEDDKIFGMIHHSRENISFKPMHPLDDDDDPLLTPTTNNHVSSAGFINTQFYGLMPQLQSMGGCRISGHLDGIGLLTQITIGEKTFRGFVLNEDFAALSPTSSPSPTFPSPFEVYAEVEKHIQACQDIYFDDATTRNKMHGIDVSTMLPHKPLSTHVPSTTLHPNSLHHHLSNGHHDSLSSHHPLDELDDDEDDRMMLHSHVHIGLHNGAPQHYSNVHHLTRHGHRSGEAGSSHSTDSEDGLGGYDLSKTGDEPSLSAYDGFSSPADPDVFLSTPKSHHSEMNYPTSNGNNSNITTNEEDTIDDGLDVIADDMPSELDITKHTQDTPIHKPLPIGGMLNTHMLISPRHLMNV